MNRAGTLYIIATPIGNLGDMTIRAVDTLRSVDRILAEDTRVTKKLLMHYDISTPISSYHTHSNQKRDQEIVKRLQEGESFALVTDAGTPGISDPGGRLVDAVRNAVGEKPYIVPIPGASAVTTFLSVAASHTTAFTFLGFLPHKKGREKFFAFLKDSDIPLVFYESPHRIMKTLGRLAELLDTQYRIVVGRELTKIHEEIVSGTAPEVFNHFTSFPDHQRGEFVVFIEKTKKK